MCFLPDPVLFVVVPENAWKLFVLLKRCQRVVDPVLFVVVPENAFIVTLSTGC